MNFEASQVQRILLEVVVVGVRLEGHEARRRVEMALLAGLQAIVRMHAGGRIVDALDRVASRGSRSTWRYRQSPAC